MIGEINMRKLAKLKYQTSFLVLLLIMVSSSAFAIDNSITITPFNSNICRLYNVDIKTDHGSIYLTNHDNDDFSVEITDEYDLYIDGDKIKTDDQQKELLKDCYILTYEISTDARSIGFEGMKIGIKGLKLGIRAIGGVIRLLSPSYDSDDLERDMEYEANKLEKEAESIEDKADLLEEKAKELEIIAETLCEEIPELQKLDWF